MPQHSSSRLLCVAVLFTTSMAGCASRSDEQTLSAVKKAISRDTGVHNGVVVSASNITFVHLDSRERQFRSSEKEGFRLELEGGTCLLLENESGRKLLSSVNDKPVFPLKSRNLRYRYDQNVTQNWPAQAFESNAGCLPAISEGLEIATVDDFPERADG
jgi:hypothetical protein